MGKKGKKKGGDGSSSGKKKKGKKGKKEAEPQITWKEALLAYQINIKERAMEDVQYELRGLEEKNERHKERNERLLQEQEFYMDHLLKQAKEFEDTLEQEPYVEKESVITVMKDKWEVGRLEDIDIAALKEQIALKDAEIAREEQQVVYWQQYKETGDSAHKTQIALLEQELEDMRQGYDEMAVHLERTLGHAKTEIEKDTDDRLDQQKYLATEKAMSKMDKTSRQEVLDNDWLKREVEIHKRESDELMAEVEVIERENLDVMETLFECTVDDLKISRNFFLTQFSDNENLEETGILEIDLAKVSLDEKERKQANREMRLERPRSATSLKVEEKLANITSLIKSNTAEEDETEAADEHEGDDTDESDYDGDNAGYNSDEEDPFNNYYSMSDEAFDDYLQLGPLELKLLSIRGNGITLHKPKTPSPEELESESYRPGDKWPVTKEQIQKVGTPRHRVIEAL